jgi:3-hydroxyisobutyrate dehydrogenase
LETLGAGAAESFMLGDRGPRMLQAYDDGGAEVRSRPDIVVKDMGMVTGAAKAVHLATPVAAAAEQLFLLGEARGLAASGHSAVITVVAPSRDAEVVHLCSKRRSVACSPESVVYSVYRV